MTWKNYFPFSAGDNLNVDGPLSYDGGAVVNKMTDDALDLHIRIPARHILFQDLPNIDTRFELVTSKEGGGNVGVVTYGGTETKDENIRVTSDPKTQTRKVAFSKKINGKEFYLNVLMI